LLGCINNLDVETKRFLDSLIYKALNSNGLSITSSAADTLNGLCLITPQDGIRTYRTTNQLSQTPGLLSGQRVAVLKSTVGDTPEQVWFAFIQVENEIPQLRWIQAVETDVMVGPTAICDLLDPTLRG
jgi:hypothetical protein